MATVSHLRSIGRTNAAPVGLDGRRWFGQAGGQGSADGMRRLDTECLMPSESSASGKCGAIGDTLPTHSVRGVRNTNDLSCSVSVSNVHCWKWTITNLGQFSTKLQKH